ncbi:MAG: WavE lipopolysaccharide synthesis family protein [Verrucomicrobiota bacterium]
MSPPAVNPSEIDVVVQGAVAGRPGDPPHQRLTEQCLANFRRILPGARLILSTWEGADVSGLDFDELVTSADPGGQTYLTRGGRKRALNMNRQIVSTRAGLQAASRPLALKFRTDVTLSHGGFLDYWGRHPVRAERWKVLGERVLVPGHFSPSPYRMARQGFVLSDWATFGRLEDVRRVWSLPLVPDEDMDYYERHPERAHPLEGARTRYAPEQYLWLHLLRSHHKMPCEHQWDFGPHNVEAHQLLLANNTVVLEPARFGLRFRKYSVGLLNKLCMYSYPEWLGLYRAYCDPRAEGDDRPLRVGLQTALANWIERHPTVHRQLERVDYHWAKWTAQWAKKGWW